MTDEQIAAVKKKLADERQARAKALDDRTKAAGQITPSPTQSENDQFATQLAAGTLPHPPWYHKADGSAIDPSSPDPSPPGPPTWP